MGLYGKTSQSPTIPDLLSIKIPAGEIIREIDNLAAGLGIGQILIGQLPTGAESEQVTLKTEIYPEYGAHTHWTGEIKSDGDLYVKGVYANGSSGKYHALAVRTDPA